MALEGMIGKRVAEHLIKKDLVKFPYYSNEKNKEDIDLINATVPKILPLKSNDIPDLNMKKVVLNANCTSSNNPDKMYLKTKTPFVTWQ